MQICGRKNALPSQTRPKQGDHGWVEQNPESVYLPEEVFVAERDAITKRRPNIKATKNNDGVDCLHTTGLALSGGGIRSASFGLGALQALQATFENKIIHGIEEIDYLSTVSGGGYIGCAMTAAMQNTGGEFPFTKLDQAETDAVRHIRDYSNYLISHGALDVITALGIIGRGLAANVFIVLPILLFFDWVTLVIHPTVESLATPKFLLWNLADGSPGCHRPCRICC